MSKVTDDSETTVRAGVVPVRRIALYGAIAVLVIAAFGAAGVAVLGPPGVFPGALVGLGAGIAALVALFKRDAIVLTDAAILLRTPWHETPIEWDRVVAGRFTLDDRDRWALALDLTEGDEQHGELVLLSIPPVTRPVSGAYDLRKREQVSEIREMLRRKRIPVTVLPEIAAALNTQWKIAPPTR
ncbi:hypothetical protein ACFVMC_07560 [Nocardia sp. NPDC127579]|uniref:hypothetical protein n=1 Tax=Nocardia sp. NPDC127579 TaxID=3345402 RepID=UPI0036322937